MTMSLNIDPGAPAADPAAPASAEAAIWQHAAFCEVGLPARTPRNAWQRGTGTVSIHIEPGANGHVLPGGPLLRLIILFVCDRAFRANSTTVELGANEAALAAEFGADVDARETAEQVERLLAAKMTVSLDGAPGLTMFDARSRPRAAGSAWRPSVRLNGGFLASLMKNAVPLDRRIIGALRHAPLALDAYAWIRQTLRRQASGPIITTSWDDLLARFGTPSQDGATFRSAFETALRAVFDADLSISIAADDEGVSVEHAAPRKDGAPPSEAPKASAPPVAAEPAPLPPAAAPAGQPQPPRPASGSPEPPQPATPVSGATQDMISLRSHVTGLAQVIWLRRGHGPDSPLVGITPGTRFDADRLTVLAVEPMVMQVSGGLNRHDFELAAAWVMVNRDLIDGFWEGSITTFEDANRRVRRVPALSARAYPSPL